MLVSIKGYAAFGIATSALDHRSDSFKIIQTDGENFPYYGVSLVDSRYTGNFGEFRRLTEGRYTGEMEKYQFSFDPRGWLLTVEGGRLTEPAQREIKPGDYYFLAFLWRLGAEMKIEFE